MEYTSKRVLAEEFFMLKTPGILGKAVQRLVKRAERDGIMLIGMPAEAQIDGCFHVARLVEGTLENGKTHVNVEVE